MTASIFDSFYTFLTDRSPLSAFRPINPQPVRYAASGPDRTSTPIVQSESIPDESGAGKSVNPVSGGASGTVLNVPTAVPSADDESGVGKTVNTAESGAGKTVNSAESDAGKTVNSFQAGLGDILARVKGANGPPFNPFKWCLANTPPPVKLDPATFIPNPDLMRHVDRKRHLDSGDYNMFRYTNMRIVV